MTALVGTLMRQSTAPLPQEFLPRYRCIQFCGSCYHLGDGVSLGHGKNFSQLLRLRVSKRAKLVVVLTGHTAREHIVMDPRVWDHEVPLVMLLVNLLFTRQVDLSLVSRKCAITKIRG